MIIIPQLANAQEQWNEKDSIFLSKMLNEEIPIHINENFRIELEENLFGQPQLDNNLEWKKLVKPLHTPSFNLHDQSFKDVLKLTDKFNPNNSFYINNPIDKNPFLNIHQNFRISTSINKQVRLNFYGSYELCRKKSPVLPINSIPYQIGVGISYDINRYIEIESLTNYQYNLIYKKREWFMGIGLKITF